MYPDGYDDALNKLRQRLPAAMRNKDVIEIVAAKDEVFARFGPVFRVTDSEAVDLAEFRAFLDFRNNKHWGGLHRQVTSMFADQNVLRNVLSSLADETKPMEQRYDKAISSVKGMGNGIITAVLHVAYPEKYSVWNNTAEGALRQLDLWPSFERATTNGSKYAKLNEVIKRIAADLGLDLWTLDSVWWALVTENGGLPSSGSGTVSTSPAEVVPNADGNSPQAFALERHLHDFLVDNWAKTDLGKEWDIYSEEGKPLVGNQYPCEVGYIDLLCKHKSQPRWLVIELKRAQTSDATVGQVLRYIGWVQRNLASPGDSVEGLVIARSADRSLEYALDVIPNVLMHCYEVEFRLIPHQLSSHGQ